VEFFMLVEVADHQPALLLVAVLVVMVVEVQVVVVQQIPQY
jgi:hypothetical protein